MTTGRGAGTLHPNDIWEVSDAAGRLAAYGCYISAQHLKDDGTRFQFNRELAYYARRIVQDVEERRLSKDEGLLAIRSEKVSLMSRSAEIASQAAGFAGGVAQVATGGAICYASGGMLCGVVGVPLMAHGANNIYENGRNLYEGENTAVGPVKRVYQQAARSMGYEDRQGRQAYHMGDLALSGYGAMRLVLKADAWRLFRYMRADKERAYQQMSKRGLML